MHGELSPIREHRKFTPVEAIIDLMDMASRMENWTLTAPLRWLAERWRWNHHQKVERFLQKCERLGLIQRDKNVTKVCKGANQIIVLPPSGYDGGRTAERDKNVTKAGHLHYNRERDIKDSSVFSNQDPDSGGNNVSPNPQLELGGGVRGIVTPWELRRLAEQQEKNDDGN